MLHRSIQQYRIQSLLRRRLRRSTRSSVKVPHLSYSTRCCGLLIKRALSSILGGDSDYTMFHQWHTLAAGCAISFSEFNAAPFSP
ncbi:MAG: hypothetical protein H7126_09280 [Candidatus Parcubacteria bacterium]|uniref:hypothetical protein n=1 Tax=Phormidesmis priestleyi TaxID=268141 RepID=UPI0012E9770D|nr:hypothetical protein [Phormidesmis priestleyi]MBC7824059.1 hypothetical protein [Leptolyngbyaceae cyanobacterium LF-bin-113]